MAGSFARILKNRVVIVKTKTLAKIPKKRYVFKSDCRACGGKKFQEIIDLGEMPLANAFLTKDRLADKELCAPLTVYFCKSCALVQLRHVVDPKILFKDYHYQTSASAPLVLHFKKLAQEIMAKHIKSKNDLVVEIGSNDGSLLENIKTSCRVLGIDPAPGMAEIAKSKGVPTLTAFFNETAAEKILKSHGPAKVIIANNVLAHIDDLASVFEGINKLLNPTGVFIFEAHWVGNLIGKGGFDQIYHEHLCYFSLYTINKLASKFDLKILDVSLEKIHGQSIRVTLGKIGTPKKSVARTLAKEKKLGLQTARVFKTFAQKVKKNKRALVSLLQKLKRGNKKIVGYGATAKGNTLLNYCGIKQETLDFITDTTVLKQNLFTPGTHIPIVPPEKLNEIIPDYILLLSWNYAEEILKKESALRKRGVKFIIPVPRVKVI
ncbi:MAG: class I SAM-dependent methyltransferase [bacterium]|nr:class I SAM-dependent methyltransferase [bacterium]